MACQTLLSMEFSRQEYWSGLPFPSPGDPPNPGMEPGSPTLQADSLPSEPPVKPHDHTVIHPSSNCWFQQQQLLPTFPEPTHHLPSLLRDTSTDWPACPQQRWECQLPSLPFKLLKKQDQQSRISSRPESSVRAQHQAARFQKSQPLLVLTQHQG